MHLVLLGLGGVIALVGLFLFVGNLTGLFVSVPYAGFITTGIGVAILRAGWKKMQQLQGGG